MILPFEGAILTRKEVELLLEFMGDGKKIKNTEIKQIYDRLQSFVNMACHYENHLRDFHPDDYARRNHNHENTEYYYH